ncbi:MAG: hypothetical protein AB1442_03970 [Nitrospirota bacterium]
MGHRQNYLERMELNKQRRLEAALVSECFPEVSDIRVHMTYYHKGVNPVLMLRKVNYWPSRHAYFNMDCMITGCVDGGFDLTPVIQEMVKDHRKAGKGRLVCNGNVADLSSDHASIAYQITVTYNKTQ